MKHEQNFLFLCISVLLYFAISNVEENMTTQQKMSFSGTESHNVITTLIFFLT